MTRAFPHGDPFQGTGKITESRIRERDDADHVGALPSASIQNLYDTALERSAVGDRSLQRYLAVLIAAPRSA